MILFACIKRSLRFLNYFHSSLCLTPDTMVSVKCKVILLCFAIVLVVLFIGLIIGFTTSPSILGSVSAVTLHLTSQKEKQIEFNEQILHLDSSKGHFTNNIFFSLLYEYSNVMDGKAAAFVPSCLRLYRRMCNNHLPLT